MWIAQSTVIQSNEVTKFRIYKNEKVLSRVEVIDAWIQNVAFRIFYNSILEGSEFQSFYWEHPAITQDTIHETYEFVLVKSTSLNVAKPNPEAFKEYFKNNQSHAAFKNLRGDASLIAPALLSEAPHYTHLANFVRNAPQNQRNEFWELVGASYKRSINTQKKWLSTAGNGVYWLHVRIDTRPKYYKFKPYK